MIANVRGIAIVMPLKLIGIIMKFRFMPLLLIAILACVSAVRAEGDGSVTYTLDLYTPFECESLLQTNWPSTLAGSSVNALVGAERFYNAGYTGQNTITANVEAGLAWGGSGGHDTLNYLPSGSFYTAPLAAGEVDRHATWVSMMIAGRGSNGYSNRHRQRH